MPMPGTLPQDNPARPPASVRWSPVCRSSPIDVISSAYGTAAEVHNADGRAPLLLVCEHASPRIPERFGTLGLDPADVRAHIGWDIGALDLARALSDRLDAPLVHAGMSRLIYDCNRPPDSPTAIRDVSEHFQIPGNRGLSEPERAERVQHCYLPFLALLEDSVERAIERTPFVGTPNIITIHTFTPVFDGKARAVELGVLHGSDPTLADRMLRMANAVTGLKAERNAPYDAADGVLHTIEQQAVARGLPGVMLEVRNDLVDTPQRVAAVSDRLARLIGTVIAPQRRDPAEHDEP
jgi:predicted N-formylglutamate amidohydrolase